MKRFFSALKATQRFHHSNRPSIHGDSYRRLLYLVNNTGLSSSLSSGHYYSTSNRLMNPSAHENITKKVDLEIISREVIKPASPTPRNLKTFKLSIIDQIMYDCYILLILFLPNTNNTSVTNVIMKRSQNLKNSLSEILTRFFPLAGEIKDNFHIECNDKGVYYIEARVNETLEDFLCQPDDEKVRELRPESLRTPKSSIGNYVVGGQVNIFNCGGIGLCTSMTHKIIDGHSYFTFMKAWAAAARGSTKIISPSFVASEIFPNSPYMKYSMPSKLMTTKSLRTKRFVFDSKALSLLKTQPLVATSRGPTRMEATTALIWKVAAKVASTVRPLGPQSPYVISPIVNFRNRASPPFPKHSIGNIIDFPGSFCFPNSELHLPKLMGQLRESIEKINSEHKKGENGCETYNEKLKSMNHITEITGEGDLVLATSLLNSGVYELDFGWGKPVWFCFMNPGFTRIIALSDTRKGGGVEAFVTMSPDEMKIFECDPELLSYVNVDPSPLQFL